MSSLYMFENLSVECMVNLGRDVLKHEWVDVLTFVAIYSKNL